MNENEASVHFAGEIERIHHLEIRIDGGSQMRAGLNEETVQEYAQAMLNHDRFPPCIVFYDGMEYWMADGFHRLAAFKEYIKRIGINVWEIECEVRSGARRDAILYAAQANSKHGLRRTNADKRRAVETLLNDEEWRQWSDREIARRCAVGHPLVAEMRSHLEEIPDTPRKFTRNGTTYTMDTANIGARTAPVRDANVDDGWGPAEDDVPAIEYEEPAEDELPDEWAAGAVGLNRDWSDEELADYAKAHEVVVTQAQPTAAEESREYYTDAQKARLGELRHVYEYALQTLPEFCELTGAHIGPVSSGLKAMIADIAAIQRREAAKAADELSADVMKHIDKLKQLGAEIHVEFANEDGKLVEDNEIMETA